jgi:hypothetical protein
MSSNAISSVNATQGGERVILSAIPVSPTVPASARSTDATVAPDALLETIENHAVVVGGRRGDGRILVPIQDPDPALLHDDDLWVGKDGLGVPVIRYRQTGTTVEIPFTPAGPSGSGYALECLTNGLAKGTLVRALVSGTLKCDLAYTGTGSLAAGAYRAVGLLNANVVGATPVEILVSGQQITLTGPQIGFLLGGPTALVPSAKYWMSAIGRWSTDPAAEAGAEVIVPIGTALSTTVLLINLGPAVIL